MKEELPITVYFTAVPLLSISINVCFITLLDWSIYLSSLLMLILFIFQELERYRQVAERRRHFQNDIDDI